MIGTAAQQTRLTKLEQPGKPGARPGGVLVMPPIETDTDAWSQRAMESQLALANATRAGIDSPARLGVR